MSIKNNIYSELSFLVDDDVMYILEDSLYSSKDVAVIMYVLAAFGVVSISKNTEESWGKSAIGRRPKIMRG